MEPRSYKYLVEEFKSEVKLDKKAIMECVQAYRATGSVASVIEFKRLWPEYKGEIAKVSPEDIPNTVLKSTYYLQSRKDPKTTLPSEHHALNELILFYCQSERDKNKKLASAAYKVHDVDGFKRFNAMQLGLKVISNTFYGASGNKTFAHYDPEVAGTITWAARQCIALLTECLAAPFLFVDEAWFQEAKTQERYKKLHELGFVEARPIMEEDMELIKRRNTFRRIFDDFYRVREDVKILKIIKPRCEVVYQDTDSNYFECLDVQKFYLGVNPHDPDVKTFRCSPYILSEMMKTMICLDLFICSVVDNIIGRAPVGLGFEGSFAVCRYTNRKKKYFGIKAADDDGNVYPYKISAEGAYDDNGIETCDYDELWKPGKQLCPMKDGTFVVVDNSVLTDRNINFQDYMASMNTKITGVELTRRDPYKINNYFHVKVVSNDLRICRFNETKNEWEGIDLNTPLEAIILGCLEEFQNIIKHFQKIAALETDVLPDPYFKLEHFTKNQRYQPGESKNNVLKICQRYEREGKQRYIPEIGERLFYVISSSPEAEAMIRRGIKSIEKAFKLAKGVDEYLDEIKAEFTEEMFFEKKGALKLTYEDWINAVAISKLYHKHYLKSLASSMSLYLFGEKGYYDEEAGQIDRGEIDDSEESKFISKYQKKICDRLVEIYYPAKKIRGGGKEKVVKLQKRELKNIDENITNLIYKLFGDDVVYNGGNKGKILPKVEARIDEINILLEKFRNIQSTLTNDLFAPMLSDSEMRLFHECQSRGKTLEDEITNLEEKRASYRRLQAMLIHE